MSGICEGRVAIVTGAGRGIGRGHALELARQGAQRLVASTIEAFGTVDVVVNNAGILRDRMLFNMDEAEWDAAMAVNVKGIWNCCKAAVPAMRQAGGGGVACGALVTRPHSASSTSMARRRNGDSHCTRSGGNSLTKRDGML